MFNGDNQITIKETGEFLYEIINMNMYMHM